MNRCVLCDIEYNLIVDINVKVLVCFCTQVNNENAWDLILYVDTVHLQMFGNYTFEAKNDYGVVQHMVTLHRGEHIEVCL